MFLFSSASLDRCFQLNRVVLKLKSKSEYKEKLVNDLFGCRIESCGNEGNVVTETFRYDCECCVTVRMH